MRSETDGTPPEARDDSWRGKCVLLTRPEGSASTLAGRIAARGARVVHAPAIRIETNPEGASARDARRRLVAVDGVIFTSRRGVDGLLGDRPAPEGSPPTYVVGRATRRACESAGFDVAVVSRGGAVELARAIAADRGIAGRTYLWPRGDRADTSGFEAVVAAGAIVEDVVVYVTRDAWAAGGRPADEDLAAVDAALVASPSAVQAVTDSLDEVQRSAARREWTIVAIGPTTARAARERGWDRIFTAAFPDDDALFDALEQTFDGG